MSSKDIISHQDLPKSALNNAIFKNTAMLTRWWALKNPPQFA